MENFDFNERPVVKEKNVFLLHLDIPRIILISAVLIGILVTTFLLGMNFSENKVISHNAMSTPELPMDTLSQLDKGIDLNNPTLTTDPLLTDNSSGKISEPTQNSDTLKLDILPKKEDTENLIAKSEDQLPVPGIHSEVKKESTVKQVTSKVTKKDTKQKSVSKKNKVVEVAKVEESHVKNASQSSWSIQVASYNTLSKAQKEARSLQAINYDAYVDKANVSGKTYYRVKIGPILKEDKALQIWKDIQSIDKYKESYIVKE